MMHRIRTAVQESSCLKLGGSGSPIEVDETFIGGKARNMHVQAPDATLDLAVCRGGKC